MQAASACAFSAAGTGEALMTSTHTSFAAARAPARLPLAALLQMPSTLLLRLAESVVAFWAMALHSATAAATSAELMGLAGVVLAVDVEGADVVAAVVVAPDAVDVEPLVVELLLLPQPATSTPQSSALASSEDRLPIIGPPCIEKTLACGRAAGDERLIGQG